MLLKRTLIVSLSLTICTIVLLVSHSQLGSALFLLTANLIVTAGLWEFFLMSRQKDKVFASYGVFCGIFYCTFAFFTYPNPLLTPPLPGIALSIVCVCLLFLFFTWRVIKGDFHSAIFDFAALVAGLVFVAWLFSFVIKINYLPAAGREGSLWVISLILIVAGADSFALLFGKAFGKRKFFPRISPNKTFEGFLGGTLSGIAIAPLCWLAFNLSISLSQSLLLGCVLSLVGHLGDLAESVLKRDAGIKDSGKLPGVGGMLDLMDSILFAAPILYFFMKQWLVP